MQVIAGEIGALTTEIDTFILNTPVNLAWFSHIESNYRALLSAASPTQRLFKRDIPLPGNLSAQFSILNCAVEGAVKAIQSAWRTQSFVVHRSHT
jgi:hypothetical protein